MNTNANMNMNSLIIITDERRIGGMLNAVRPLGGQVTAAVVGRQALAGAVSSMGFDRVLCLEPAENAPAEAYAAQLADVVFNVAPRLIITSDVAVSRMLLAAAAACINAAVIGAARAFSVKGDNIVISRFTADDKVLEDIEAIGGAAAIFNGEDVEVQQAAPIEVEIVPAGPCAGIRFAGTIESEGGNGLLTAARVVSAGIGVKAKDDLRLIEELAEAANAEIGCSLPICEDMRWLSLPHVVGSTHNQIAPELYIAVGISGQPQHMAGIRDAKIVVAINNDPEARIFKFCNYGVVGDLYKIVPALTTAFKGIS